MTVNETVKYLESMRNTAKNDVDKRAVKCVDALDSALSYISERSALQNRCFVFSKGAMCPFCKMECDALGKLYGSRMRGRETND